MVQRPLRQAAAGWKKSFDEVIEAGRSGPCCFHPVRRMGGTAQGTPREAASARKCPSSTAGTSKVERQAMVDRFQDDPRGPQLFLLSLKPVGWALTPTAPAHTRLSTSIAGGIPAVENQATDRALTPHGQTNRGAGAQVSSPAARWKRRSRPDDFARKPPCEGHHRSGEECGWSRSRPTPGDWFALND